MTNSDAAAWQRLGSRDIPANGITLRVTEHGAGPAVVLCHGFPELGFSWRHQVLPLAEAGYRVLVPDLRGYGDSSRPADPAAYDIVTLCGDLAGLLDACDLSDAAFAGHDWGAVLVWQLALLHPDRVRAVAGLSVPPSPRPPAPPVPILRARFGDDFYICRFQEPGSAERLLEADVRATMASVMADQASRDWLTAPAPAALPAWLTEAELGHYVRAFERTGFTGGLNYYRNLDRNWELTAHLADRMITQPAMFLTGSADPVQIFMPGTSIDRAVTDLREHVVIDGAGHWVQQQRPAEVTAALLRFLKPL